MEAIYPISALQKDAASVRRDAEVGIVRLTVDGRGKYVFATEEVLEDYVQRKIDEASYERRVAEALERAAADEREGRELPADESWAKVWEARSVNAAS